MTHRFARKSIATLFSPTLETSMLNEQPTLAQQRAAVLHDEQYGRINR
jgi:hypothetical protein